MSIDLMHGTTFVSYSPFAVAANLRGRGLSQSSPSCYSETAPFQDGKQSQMHSHGFYLTIAATETSPGLGGYATCRFLVLADGLVTVFPLLYTHTDGAQSRNLFVTEIYNIYLVRCIQTAS